MFDERAARSLAETRSIEGATLGPARELREGWFFPWITALIGSKGVIVHKQTGHVFELGSAFPLERDLAFYDQGFQSDLYDLVVTKVRDLAATRRALEKLDFTVVEPTYEHGQVWRVPRRLTTREIAQRLENLPALFPAVGLYFRLEVLDEARREGWFEFQALACPRSAERG